MLGIEISRSCSRIFSSSILSQILHKFYIFVLKQAQGIGHVPNMIKK